MTTGYEKQRGISPHMTALIVGGSPKRPSVHLLQALAMQANYIVACDSGADACRIARIRVDVLIGDEDSVSPEGLDYVHDNNALVYTYDSHKDQTDFELALEHVKEVGIARGEETTVVCTGITGGRLDHELAALGCVSRFPELDPLIEEDDTSAFILHPEHRNSWEASSRDVQHTVSVIGLTQDAEVSETGFTWDADHKEIGILSDLGVSNIVEKPDAVVEIHKGTALFMIHREPIAKRLKLG